MKPISRRDFLKLSALSLGSFAFAPYTPFFPETTGFEDANLVRVTRPSISVYTKPKDDSTIVGQWFRDDLVHVYKEVISDSPKWNPRWYRVWGGYLHSKHLQKVRVFYNEPQTTIPEAGQLGQVTVPYTQAYTYSEYSGWQTVYRLYYESVHWVKGVEQGPDGAPWYRLLDEADEAIYYVPAIHLRLIPAEEIAPISPEIPMGKKRIEILLETQTLNAYQYDQLVFQTKISSGLAGKETSTPRGRFNIMVKMPSKHMGLADLAAGIDAYVLPGVPWCSFIVKDDGNYTGVAFHGTYWHDNFGVPMSHGCINMRTAEALWLFRWTNPPAGYDELSPSTLDSKGRGTAVTIE